MKILFALSFLFSLQAVSQQFPHEAHVLFLGNSITYDGRYIAYAESWLTTRYPDKSWQFVNMGVPSETVSGLSEPGHANGQFPRPVLKERLARVMDQFSPQIIFACYGMNDGIYLPFSPKRFRAYKKGIRHLIQEARNRNSRLILITPPIYDNPENTAYSYVLDRYSSWLLSLKHQEVIDIHFPMKAFLEAQRATNPDFKLAADGVHPAETGHWLMARSLLAAYGEQVSLYATAEEAVGSAEIISLVKKKQQILRDAWLQQTGHKRPGLAGGLPMVNARKEAEFFEKQIQSKLKFSQ